MKVAYKHLLNFLDDKPTIDDLSNKLFQLGHENEFKNEIFYTINFYLVCVWRLSNNRHKSTE